MTNENVFTFDEDLELQIIKNALSSREFLVSVIEYLRPEYFRNNTCKVICKIIKNHFSKYSDVPTLSIIVTEAKEVMTPRDDVDLFNKNIKEIDRTPVKDSGYLKTKVLDFCKTQALIGALADSIDHIKRKEFKEIETKLKKAFAITENTDVGLDYFTDVQERLVSELKYKKYIKTGFSSLNRITKGGWSVEDTTLTIVVAPTGVGKSLLLIKFAAAAVLTGMKALYITHELSQQRAAARFDSIFTKITQNDRLNKTDEIVKKLDIIKGMCGKNLMIKEFHTKTCSTNMISAYLNKLKNQGFSPDVIFNDYMDIMIPSSKSSNDDSYSSQKIISEELRALAQDSVCPIITASQTNRPGSDKEVIRNTDVAESFGKVFTSDLILTINQTDKDKLIGRCKLYIAKNRNGPSGISIPLAIDYERMDITEFVEQQGEESGKDSAV